MPEYLAPGVYVEEVSFRSKSIEGVPTSTTGFAGMTRTGPVNHPNGPAECEPRLITSFTEFERVYGSLEPLRLNDKDPTEERLPYLAHAARAFFENGGKRLYVSRVFVPRDGNWGIASKSASFGKEHKSIATWTARWPGAYGNVQVTASAATRSGNLLYAKPKGQTKVYQARQVQVGSVVEVIRPPATTSKLYVVKLENGEQVFVDHEDNKIALDEKDIVRLVDLNVTIEADDGRTEQVGALVTSRKQPRYIGDIMSLDRPEDADALIWLDLDIDDKEDEDLLPVRLMAALVALGPVRLEGGHDGILAQPDHLKGKAADPDKADVKATGLEALAEIEDIAIVALPDGSTYDDHDLCAQAADRLIGHAERMRYRIAVIDGPRNCSLNQIRAFRARFDSSHAALYHPWIEILDPTASPAAGAPRRLLLPPSGFVTGIYARTDVTRGVHKAPANEVVRGLTRFEANINTPRQDVLNPEGINALRFFEGRGYRVWGARTMSSDPEWKYVNVRRLFAFLEHSIDRGSQWAVFEPNSQRLWDNVRRTIEDFLLVLWKNGALLGSKPEEAYFVRCDRTTMTQNDLDNGRLVCLVGVAPVKPAEFVIFRIGQWTADARQV